MALVCVDAPAANPVLEEAFVCGDYPAASEGLSAAPRRNVANRNVTIRAAMHAGYSP